MVDGSANFQGPHGPWPVGWWVRRVAETYQGQMLRPALVMLEAPKAPLPTQPPVNAPQPAEAPEPVEGQLPLG